MTTKQTDPDGCEIRITNVTLDPGDHGTGVMVPPSELRKVVRPIVMPTTRNFSAVLMMTSDRPCISERGLMVHAGVKVTYLGHLSGQAVKVRMEDGSEEILHPHCFPELR